VGAGVFSLVMFLRKLSSDVSCLSEHACFKASQCYSAFLIVLSKLE
jgi:hypothetical protein